MLGKSLSQFAFPRQFISKSLNSRNRVDPLSPREKLLSNFDSSREIRENEFWHSNCQKKRRKENERVERGKEIVTSGLRMHIEEKIGRENGGIGHSSWRKEQERG